MSVGPRAYVALAVAGVAATIVAAVISRRDVKIPLVAPSDPPAAPRVELLVISASWCGPCRQLHAELDAHGDVLKDAGVHVEVLTDDRAAERKYKVVAYPTVIALRDGTEVGRRTGYATAAELLAWIGGR